MWKMAGWLAKTVAAGLIISFLSIWTTGYIVNSYVETLLKQFNIPLEQKPFALSSVWGGLWGADPMLKEDMEATTSEEDSNGESSNGGHASDSSDSSGSNHASKNGGITSHEEQPGANIPGSGSGLEGDASNNEQSPLAIDAYKDSNAGALTDIGGGLGTKANSGATSGTGSGGEAGEAMKEGVAITPEDLSRTKDAMNSTDKQKLFEVMMKKLPQDAWQQISAMMEGGITNTEMTTIQQIIAQYLDRAEYDQMVEIMKKY